VNEPSPDWRSELRRSWASLGPGGSDARGLRAVVLIRTSDDRPIRVGVDGLGRRCLLVAVQENDSPEPPGVDSALGLDIEPLIFGGQVSQQLVVRCRRSDLFDLFDDLLVSVLEEVTSSSQPASTIASAVDRWRELLRARSATGLNVRQEMGLFGELRVFEVILETLGPLSIDIWRGPLNEPKDFLLVDRFVEVKSCGPAQTSVSIHGLEQLSLADGLPGLLVILEVYEAASGRSIENVVSSLEDHGVQTSVLRERLLEVGWAPISEPRRWEVSDVVVAQVADIPRLVPEGIAGGVPLGVSRVEYQLDLAVVRAKCRMGVAALAAALTGVL